MNPALRWSERFNQQLCLPTTPVQPPATIVDDVGSAAMSTITTKPHVSLTITTNYLRAVPLGSTIRITGKVGQAWRLAALPLPCRVGVRSTAGEGGGEGKGRSIAAPVSRHPSNACRS